MSAESWLPIVGYKGFYEVSDTGCVRSVDRWVGAAHGGRRLARGRALALKPLPSGHLTVNLWRDGVGHTELTHRLVLIAFVGPAPDGHECCHDDGDPSNNAASNLYWGTRSQNQQDCVRHGTHPWASRTECSNGHEYNGINTLTTSKGRRVCRPCRNDRIRRFHQKRKTAA